MSKILVTGGAGFIGSHLCDRLLKEGHFVACLDNFNNYYDPLVKLENIKNNFSNPNFKLLVEDTENREKLEYIFEQYDFDVVIHLAARAGVRGSIEHILDYRDTNIIGTINLLELCKIHNVKNFIYASSSSVYGNNDKVPFNEDDFVDKPISPYATTKRTGELFCYTYHHLCGINTTVLRFFNVYGPRNRPDMAHFTFTKAIFEGTVIKKFGDGTVSRDYTYIDDIINGVITCLDKHFGYEIINLGNSDPVSLTEMIETLENCVGIKAKTESAPLPQGDVVRTYADISKAKKLLNWEPITSYKEGVKKLVTWYNETYKNLVKL